MARDFVTEPSPSAEPLRVSSASAASVSRAGAERPIIFSAPMVRALLAGRKTQTRRIIKDEVPEPPGMDAVHPNNRVRHPAPYLDSYCNGPRSALNPRRMSNRWCWWTRDDRQCLPTFRVPYVPGDRLWVKETWARIDGDERDAIGFRADCEGQSDTWRPSLFMPRALSRLTLIVTDVRVERLAQISRADAIAEGATMRPKAYRGTDDGWCMDWSPVGRPSRWATDGRMLSEEDICFWRPQDAFGSFINELHDPRWNYKGDGIFGENPWVVAITFKVIRANIDELPQGIDAVGQDPKGLGAEHESPSAEGGAP